MGVAQYVVSGQSVLTVALPFFYLPCLLSAGRTDPRLLRGDAFSVFQPYRSNFSDGRYAQNYKKYESKKSHIVTQAHASLALLQKNFQIKIHGYCVGIGRDFLLVDEQTEAVTLVERAFGSDGIDGDETAGSDGSAAQ